MSNEEIQPPKTNITRFKRWLLLDEEFEAAPIDKEFNHMEELLKLDKEFTPIQTKKIAHDCIEYLEAQIAQLEKDKAVAIEALERIKGIESWSERPGGGTSSVTGIVGAVLAILRPEKAEL